MRQKQSFDALLPDIEEILDQLDDHAIRSTTNLWIVDAGLITRLAKSASSQVEVAPLVRMCGEINSSYAQGIFSQRPC